MATSAQHPVEQTKPLVEAATGIQEATEKKHPAARRLLALDAFRGLIMTSLAAHGFGLASLQDHPSLGWLGRQFRHVPWEGMVYWDLIQPAFMFMVGLSMPFALAARRRQGASSAGLFRHVAWRTFMLLLLSQVLICVSSGQLKFQLINVLSQIAFTYILCYGIIQLSGRGQALAAVLLLSGHWALFLAFPGSDGALSKEDNIGAIIDRFLGLHYSGYYVTLNFIPSTVTTLFGVWAGLLMMRRHSHSHRVKVLAGAAAACFAGGLLMSLFNPMVKRLWTASFTLASAGWVFLMLLALYWLVEVKEYRKAVYPLVVVGVNSIFVYSMHMVLDGWFDRAVGVFTAHYNFLGAFSAVAQATTVFAAMWLICYWLYRRKLFIKI